MDAATEADVRVGTAVGLENLGIVELVRVAVGRSEKEPDLVALFEAEALVLDVFESVAFEHVERGIKAQHFLAAAGRGCGKVGEGRVGQESLNPIAECVDTRLVAGVEEEDGGGNKFLLAKKVTRWIPCGDELREEILSGMTAQFFQALSDIGTEGEGGLDGSVLDLAIAASLVDSDHVMGPREELGSHFLGYTEEAGNDADRNGAGE